MLAALSSVGHNLACFDATAANDSLQCCFCAHCDAVNTHLPARRMELLNNVSIKANRHPLIATTPLRMRTLLHVRASSSHSRAAQLAMRQRWACALQQMSRKHKVSKGPKNGVLAPKPALLKLGGKQRRHGGQASTGQAEAQFGTAKVLQAHAAHVKPSQRAAGARQRSTNGVKPKIDKATGKKRGTLFSAAPAPAQQQHQQRHNSGAPAHHDQTGGVRKSVTGATGTPSQESNQDRHGGGAAPGPAHRHSKAQGAQKRKRTPEVCTRCRTGVGILCPVHSAPPAALRLVHGRTSGTASADAISALCVCVCTPARGSFISPRHFHATCTACFSTRYRACAAEQIVTLCREKQRSDLDTSRLTRVMKCDIQGCDPVLPSCLLT